MNLAPAARWFLRGQRAAPAAALRVPLGRDLARSRGRAPGPRSMQMPTPTGPSWRSVTCKPLPVGRSCAYRLFGAHLVTHGDVSGVRFAVWAPTARRVSVVGSFNNWDGRRHPMRHRHSAWGWEIFIPHVSVGDPTSTRSLRPTGCPSRPTLRLCRRDAAQHGQPGRAATAREPTPRDRRLRQRAPCAHQRLRGACVVLAARV